MKKTLVKVTFSMISNTNSYFGWCDLASLNLRYIDSKLFNENCPLNQNKKKYLKFLLQQSIVSGFREFKGCEKNIKEILPDFKKSFFQIKINLITKCSICV